MTGQDNRYPDFARGSQDMLWTGGEIRIAAGFGTDRLVSSSKFPPVADGNYRTDHTDHASSCSLALISASMTNLE